MFATLQLMGSSSNGVQHQSTEDIITTGDDQQPVTWLIRSRKLFNKGEKKLSLTHIEKACKLFGTSNAVVWKEQVNFFLELGPYSMGAGSHAVGADDFDEGTFKSGAVNVTDESAASSLERLIGGVSGQTISGGKRQRDDSSSAGTSVNQPASSNAAAAKSAWFDKLCSSMGSANFSTMIQAIEATMAKLASGDRASTVHMSKQVANARAVVEQAVTTLSTTSRTSLTLKIGSNAPTTNGTASEHFVAPGAIQLWMCYVLLQNVDLRTETLLRAVKAVPYSPELWWVLVKATTSPADLPFSVSYEDLAEDEPLPTELAVPADMTAVELINTSIEYNPHSASLAGLLAYEYYLRGDIPSGRKALLGAVKRHRASAPAHVPPPIDLMVMSAAFEERAMMMSGKVNGGVADWLSGAGGVGTVPPQTSLVALLRSTTTPSPTDAFASHLKQLKLIINKTSKFYLVEELRNRIEAAVKIKKLMKEKAKAAEHVAEAPDDEVEAANLAAQRAAATAEKDLDALFGRDRNITVDGLSYDSDSLNPIRIRKRVYAEWLQCTLCAACEGYVWVAALMMRELAVLSYGNHVPHDWLVDLLGLCDTATDDYIAENATRGRVNIGRLGQSDNLCGGITLALQSLGPHGSLSNISNILTPPGTNQSIDVKWRRAALFSGWVLLVYTHSVASSVVAPKVEVKEEFPKDDATAVAVVDFDTQAARAALNHSLFDILDRFLLRSDIASSTDCVKSYLKMSSANNNKRPSNDWAAPLLLHLLLATAYLAGTNCGMHPPAINTADIAEAVSSLLLNTEGHAGALSPDALLNTLEQYPLIVLAVAKVLVQAGCPRAAEPHLRYALGTYECIASAVQRGREVVAKKLRDQGDASLASAEAEAIATEEDAANQTPANGWYDTLTHSIASKQRAQDVLRKKKNHIMEDFNQKLRHCDETCEQLKKLAVLSTERLLIALSRALYFKAQGLSTSNHAIFDDLGSVEIASLLDQYIRPSSHVSRVGLESLQSSSLLWRKRLTYDREPILLAINKFLRTPQSGEQQQRFPQWLLDRVDAFRSLLDYAVSDGVCPSEPVIWMLNLQEYALRLHINRGLCDDVDKVRATLREAGRIAMHNCPLDFVPPQQGTRGMFSQSLYPNQSSSSANNNSSRPQVVTPYFKRCVQLWVVLVREVLCETLSDQTGARVICAEACSKLIQLMLEVERAESGGSNTSSTSALTNEKTPLSWAIGDAVAAMYVVWGSTEHQHHASDKRWQLLKSQLTPITRNYILTMAEKTDVSSSVETTTDDIIGGSFPEALAVAREGVNRLATLYTKVQSSMVHPTGRQLVGLEIPTFLQASGLGSLAELYALWITLDSPLTKGGTIGSVMGLRRIRHPATHRALFPYLLAVKRPIEAIKELRKAVEGAEGADGDAWVLIAWTIVHALETAFTIAEDLPSLENASQNTTVIEQLTTMMEFIEESVVGLEVLNCPTPSTPTLPKCWQRFLKIRASKYEDIIANVTPNDHDTTASRRLKTICEKLIYKISRLIPAIVHIASRQLQGALARGICTTSLLPSAINVVLKTVGVVTYYVISIHIYWGGSSEEGIMMRCVCVSCLFCM
jgi:hypothetical protein